MLFLVKLFPEITIKSRPVRRRLIRQLRKNIRSVLASLDPDLRVEGEWDCLEVQPSVNEPTLLKQVEERLTQTPGVALVLLVDKYPLPDFDGMLALAMSVYEKRLAGKTFAVRCKRQGRHSFRSVDVERHVGAGLNQGTETTGVKLKGPDVTVAMEIRDEDFFLVRHSSPGIGGFPLGSQDAVLSLISGGFDSAVSSYLCIKRGLQTHYCFFNLGGKAHELAVKEVALFLWMKYHSSHRVKFISVPFEPVVAEILNKVENSQMGVVLKRMMLRAAETVAEQLTIRALVTGESVAQVSSQTLTNLAVIDKVSNTLVLRPLSTSDKQEIIDTARKIGTEDFSKNIPEYCAVISDKPTTKARLERIEAEEAKFDFAVLEGSVNDARYQLITDIVDEVAGEKTEVAVECLVGENDFVIDIRHPSELEARPFDQTAINGKEAQVVSIPFYELRSRIPELQNDKRALLYCEKGMMSRLHAAHLLDEGCNVGVLDLSANNS